MTSFDVSTVFFRLRSRARTAATPHLRRVYDTLTGEITAWAAAHDGERAERIDRDLQLAREHAHTARVVDTLQARIEHRPERMALGALLVMPWVRHGLGEDRWRYFRGQYAGGDCGLADEGVAA